MVVFSFVFVIASLLVSLSSCDSFIGVRDAGTDVFIGIPYASHPTRLQPPVPLVGDQGVVNASNPTSNRCIETGPTSSRVLGSEDCLTLDIVRPSSDSSQLEQQGNLVNVTTDHAPPQNKKLLPVYVFIHGGDFNLGDKSDYDGKALVKASINLGSPIIYVAINYRLGFLGFPSGKEAQSRGAMNLGLLDQRWSLIWLQQFIQYFGGDPEQVIIGGQGSGADAVAYHLVGYEAKSDGLFRGAILESGSATSSSPIPHPRFTSWQLHYNEIASAVGCNNSVDSWACLQNAPIGSLVKAYSKIFSDNKLVAPVSSLFSPVIDGKFFTDYPSVLMEQGKLAPVPIFIGTTTSEVVKSVPIDRGFGSDGAITVFLKSNFPYVSDATLRQLLAHYPVSNFKNTGPPLSGAQWTRLVTILNDLQIFCPETIHALQVSRVADVYKYRWNAVLDSVPGRWWEGVPQCSELRYLFPNGGKNMVRQSPADLALINSFQRRIISFINHLNPNSIASPKYTPDVIWPKFTAGSQGVIQFNSKSSPDRTLAPKQGYYDVNKTVCDFISSKNTEFLR